jgi:cell wall-associated NlpC family hydrolase
MSDTSQAQAARLLGGRFPRYSLFAAAALVVVVVAVALVLLLKDGGSHARGPVAAVRTTTGHVAKVPPAASPGAAAHRATPAHATPTGASAAAGGRANVAEVADPEEASSFPAPASVKHKAASTPSTASEQIVAAGAPSDAEVKHELAQMQAAERSAKQAQQQRLTPVKGGNSVGGNGTIPIPANVPEVIQRVVAGANAIADFPYVFGGGHGSFVDNAYDCSGSVSYALAAGGLLSAPQTSGELESWGAPGPGRYITVFANAGHTYMYIDGVLYDTAGRSGVYASRWQVSPTDNSGYVARHWPGL